jgi:serine/threonine protein kinase
MGERFGNYEILRRLAAGGMAEVLLAKHTSLGGFERLVCLKRILPHLSAQEDFLKMFQDEARIAANLVHPNIAQIYDIAQEGEHYYIAMEYVRGEDVRRVYNQEVNRGQTIPAHIAAQVIMGAAAGLDYAHRQTALDGTPLGIVHRDVSPQNIIVTYDGHAKLIDFGVAKAAGKLNQTRSGVLKGKYSYMSPEQASGDPVDGRTDVFALGIVLYEITTGTRLFKRENELETLHAVIACNVKAPSSIVPGYDPELEAIVLRALAYDAENRYATAGELEGDLERFLLNHGHPTSATHLAGYMQDLFAEKLADEALFGGPPWNETATPSRKLQERTVAEQPASVLDDATVIDPVPEEIVAAAREKSRSTSEPAGHSRASTLSDWRVEEDNEERTASGQDEPADVPAPPPRETGRVGAKPPPARLSSEPGLGTTQPARAAPPAPPSPGRRLLLGMALGSAAMLLAVIAWKLVRRHPQPPAEAPVAAFPAPPAAAPPPPPAVEEPAPIPGDTRAYLNVSAPLPLEVSLGNRYLGDTPLRRVALEPGTYRLKLESKRDGLVVRRNVRLDAGQQANVDIVLQKGSLSITGRPWAWVQIGMRPPAETPLRLELLEGEYTVIFECPDGRRKTEQVRITPGGSESAGITCDRR